MRVGTGVQRRSLSTWAGMAIGFRAFYAVIVDGGQLYGSAWLAMLAGLILALPVAFSLNALRRTGNAGGMPERLSGTWAGRVMGAAFSVVLIYDAGAVISLMSSTAKYVAMPEANRNLVKLVTAAAAGGAVLMGAKACADGAVLWRRLAAALIALLILTQARYFRFSWLTPVFGPGISKITPNALSAAGMFSFAAAGWLLFGEEYDGGGRLAVRCIAKSGIIAVLLALMLGMLIPGMMEEPATRSFRIGRLLANDRAGLTLEMPYVVLLYSGMLTMLVFELCAAAGAVRMMMPGIGLKGSVFIAGIPALLLSVGSWTEREMLMKLSMWYYPLIAVPVCLAGLAAWNRTKGGERLK